MKKYDDIDKILIIELIIGLACILGFALYLWNKGCLIMLFNTICP